MELRQPRMIEEILMTGASSAMCDVSAIESQQAADDVRAQPSHKQATDTLQHIEQDGASLEQQHADHRIQRTRSEEQSVP